MTNQGQSRESGNCRKDTDRFFMVAMVYILYLPPLIRKRAIGQNRPAIPLFPDQREARDAHHSRTRTAPDPQDLTVGGQSVSLLLDSGSTAAGLGDFSRLPARFWKVVLENMLALRGWAVSPYPVMIS